MFIRFLTALIAAFVLSIVSFAAASASVARSDLNACTHGLPTVLGIQEAETYRLQVNDPHHSGIITEETPTLSHYCLKQLKAEADQGVTGDAALAHVYETATQAVAAANPPTDTSVSISTPAVEPQTSLAGVEMQSPPPAERFTDYPRALQLSLMARRAALAPHHRSSSAPAPTPLAVESSRSSDDAPAAPEIDFGQSLSQVFTRIEDQTPTMGYVLAVAFLFLFGTPLVVLSRQRYRVATTVEPMHTPDWVMKGFNWSAC